MKITKECLLCQKKRALLICRGLDNIKKEKLKNQINDLFLDISENSCTIDVAYQRNRIIKDIAGKQALMVDLRDESMKIVEKIYPKFEQYLNKITDDKRRFYKALIIALAGNIIEFGSAGHRIEMEEIEKKIYKTIKEKPILDDSNKIYNFIGRARRILYITDNTAELVLDKLFIKELTKYAAVTVAPLSEPVQDDACLEDVKYLKIDKLPGCKVVVKGDCIGALLEKTTPEFQEEFDKADLVIAKGMACYESLSEYPSEIRGKVVFVLKAKCKPVAESASLFFDLDESLNVGANIIKFV